MARRSRARADALEGQEAYTADKIVEVTDNLTAAQARDVDARLDEKVREGCFAPGDASQIRRAARRLVQQVDPDGQTVRARRARTRRRVELLPGEDAMSMLLMALPAEVAATAYARIDRDARALRNSGDERTLEQLRADVAAALLLAQPVTGNDATQTGPASSPSVGAMVYVHMPVDTALTMSDQGAELSGYGPIPGPIAREIATNPGSVWRTVLTDPGSGVPQDISRRRRPTQAMRELVAARDRECHHYLKDEPGWRLDYDPTTGTATITSPTGRTYTKKNRPITTPKPTPNRESDIAIPEQRRPAEASPAEPNSPPNDDPPFWRHP